MLMLLHGPDTYRSLQRLHILEAGFRKKYDRQGLNIVHLDGEKLTAGELRREVTTVGFLSKKRMVVIRRLVGSKHDLTIQEDLWRIIAEHVKDAEVVMVLWEEELPAGKSAGPLHRNVLRRATEETFPLLEPGALRTWVVKEVQLRRGKIHPVAVHFLAGLTGNNLWQLSNEIAKLAGYAGARQISEEDVRLFVRGAFDADIFRLTDAIADRKTGEAAALVDTHLAAGEPPLYLLSMVARQVRILLEVQSIGADRQPSEIAKILSLHPYVVRKAIPAARKFTELELRDLVEHLAALDVTLKTSAVDPRLLFARLVARLARPTAIPSARVASVA